MVSISKPRRAERSPSLDILRTERKCNVSIRASKDKASGKVSLQRSNTNRLCLQQKEEVPASIAPVPYNEGQYEQQEILSLVFANHTQQHLRCLQRLSCVSTNTASVALVWPMSTLFQPWALLRTPFLYSLTHPRFSRQRQRKENDLKRNMEKR